MAPYNRNDFEVNEAWLIFRVDTQVKNQAVDIYMMMDIRSDFLFGTEIVIEEKLSQKQVQSLLKAGYDRSNKWPKKFILGKGDPSEQVIAEAAVLLDLGFELAPTLQIEPLIASVRQHFGRFAYSPSSMAYADHDHNLTHDEIREAQLMLPDSYDLCSCASGKKYKFCCKPVFREIVLAMNAAEEGQQSTALDWIAKAKAVVGETPEILCREAIVYNFTDPVKFLETLDRCLLANPNHPRANYVRGLNLKEKGMLKEAMSFYERAIENYPKTDKYSR